MDVIPSSGDVDVGGVHGGVPGGVVLGGGAVAGAGLEQVGDHDVVGQHVLVGGPVHGREQRGGGEDLVRLGADGAGVGFEEEVVGDGRGPVLDFSTSRSAARVATWLLSVTWAWPPAEASHTRDGSAAAGCAAGRAAAVFGLWLTGCTVLAAAVAVCVAVAVWWWVSPNPEGTAIPATAALKRHHQRAGRLAEIALIL